MKGIKIEETMHPLTVEEQALVEKYHYIIFHVLHQFRVPEDTYYDIVVLAYLNAAQRYCAEPYLQQYSFVTIANRAVEGAIRNHWTKGNKQPKCLSLDADANDDGETEFYNLLDLQSNEFEKLFEDDTTAVKRKAAKEVSKQLTKNQLQIFTFLSNGISQADIARMLGVKPVTISLTIKSVRNKVTSGKITYPACLGV